jgi:hypothetical protein
VIGSNVGGMSMPITLAVCKLMTNSILIGCIAGRSAGRSPPERRRSRPQAADEVC